MKFIDYAILAKTRAEEHEADVWGKFFIPPYFNKLGLKSATRSTYIVGKRGCGKTMLLKYMDYHTAFSPRRKEIPDDELKHIGIYWRVDTQFCNSLKSRGFDDQQWKSVFESYFSLVVSAEIIRATRAISESAYVGFTNQDFQNLEFGCAADFHPDFPTKPIELEKFLEGRRRLFSTWVSNMTSMPQPLLPPGRVFIDALISDLKNILALSDIAFYIYVDEVENLVPYQRQVLNSYLKHSQKPFIVSFTSKELSDESATTGPESVNATHDFRLVALDELMDEQSRNVFFAEVYLANLDIAAGNQQGHLVQSLLSPDELSLRHTDSYRGETLRTIRARFPSKTSKQLAKDALEEPRILRILEDRIDRALEKKKTSVSADMFMKYKDIPDALVIVPALLNRSSRTPDHVLEELGKYRHNGRGYFESTWIHNNLVGALLELYRPYQAVCPIYSGFDTFCTMASNNLRHFLILAYKALEVTELLDRDVEIFAIDIQARAAYEAAEKLIDEVKTFGVYGERLRMFVLRLGGAFRALQAQPAMSESEQNQFTINSGARSPSQEEIRFMREAMKYAILIEQLETKTKGFIGGDIMDYQLNPMYAPYFQISYRRKRKIEISVEDFHVLALGTEDEYRNLCARLIKEVPAPITTQQMGFW
ncbi:hypothetical protein HF313_00520 [Massilia atriviolacea]|uniref:Uncharacterized protein n=1 Tax=Massilia atriviolacea TaxID=2495579 RepID=A0A430HL48_9BURK|nr:hypothetical protein [Massilia atriviolacea]RSZ58219.1 hypothetical protein EJB06_14750 [Massilia atriviolacea]